MAQVTEYEGNLKNGLKNGLGKQKFSDGSIYFGYFTLGYMHGEGVMVQRDNIYKSGMMNFESFNQGLTLYPNKTVVFVLNIRSSLIKKVHQINIENGDTKCNDFDTGELSLEACSYTSIGYGKLNLGLDEFYW